MNISNMELIELQKMFRKGFVKEKDIPTDQKNALINLYHKQIEILKGLIEKDRKEILKIKEEL